MSVKNREQAGSKSPLADFGILTEKQIRFVLKTRRSFTGASRENIAQIEL